MRLHRFGVEIARDRSVVTAPIGDRYERAASVIKVSEPAVKHELAHNHT